MQGELLFNEMLAPYTSWHIGGPADRYYRPDCLQSLQAFLKTLPQNEPLTWIGLGSNVLICDEGLRGTVIHTLGMKSEITQTPDNLTRVEMGIPCAKIAKYCTKHNLKGGAFFAGIPGTLGGALAMNAGAFGGETWKSLRKIEVINRAGEITVRTPEEYEIGYRSVRRKNDNKNVDGCAKTQTQVKSQQEQEWFVAGHFQFEPDTHAQTAQEIKQLMKKRNETQPIGVFSCGSVFTNPKGHYVGQLIEQLQLKGKRMNDAEISTKHANFIINHGQASAKDVLGLMALIMETVFEKYQIVLQPEVRILGYEDPYFWLSGPLKQSFLKLKDH